MSDDTQMLQIKVMRQIGRPAKPIMRDYEYLYTQDEMTKALNAIREKYSISECDDLPYHPKSIKVKLSGKVIKDKE